MVIFQRYICIEISLFLIMGHYQSSIYLEENDFSKNLTLFLTILISWQIRRGFLLCKVVPVSTGRKLLRTHSRGKDRCVNEFSARMARGPATVRV